MAGLDGALAGVKTWLEVNILLDTVRITLPATGAPVLNTETGQLEYPVGAVLYEGPGAIIPSNATADILATPDAAEPWAQETKSRYTLLTPLSAPIAPKDAIASATVVHDAARTGLLGRTWICPDPGQASTVEVVRKTPLDQQRAAPVEGAP